MNFDPTYDYGLSNLKIEDNLVCWKFGELIKTLITISSSSERQWEIIGGGIIADEMAEDFNTYFTLSCKEYYENEMLDEIARKELNYLNDFLDLKSVNNDPSFWRNTELSTNIDWKKVRIKAKEILTLMGFENLEIYFDKTDKNFVRKLLSHKIKYD